MSFEMPKDKHGAPLPVLAPVGGRGQRITSVAADTAAAAIGAGTKIVRLHATAACHVRVGAAATNVDWMLAADETDYMKVATGAIIHVIRESADGVLQISEMQ